MASCLYISVWSQPVGWAHVLPSAVTLGLTAASLRLHGREIFPAVFGFYLHAWQGALWALQAGFNVMRSDPYCPEYRTFSFPSQETFYAAALPVFIVAYALYWRTTLGYVTWAVVYGVGIGVPALVLGYQLAGWDEVLFSWLLGALAALCFVIVVRLYITPMLPYVLNQAPWTWLGYQDTFCLAECEQKRTLYVKRCIQRCTRAIAAARRNGRRPPAWRWRRSYWRRY